MKIEYTGEILGEAWDKNTKYLLITIIKWDGTREIANKSYYFISDYDSLSELICIEEWCSYLFENYRQNSRFHIVNGVCCELNVAQCIECKPINELMYIGVYINKFCILKD